MRMHRSVLAVMSALAMVAWAADWPMPGGNPQRNGWAASERRITKANVKSLGLLYKYVTDNQAVGSDALTSASVSGNLITYLGFKEMLLFAGSSGRVYSVDADLNKVIWETKLSEPVGNAQDACSGAMTAPVVMAGSSSSSLHFAVRASQTPAVAPGATPPPPPPRRNPYYPPIEQSLYPMTPTTLTQLNALYTVSSDGKLHVLNSSTGEDLIPAMPFLPAGSRVSSLNLRDNVVYATTAGHCAGQADALYALDLLSTDKAVRWFVAPQGGFAGSGGTSIGNDGTVYVQLPYADESHPKRFYETVVALTAKELKVKDTFVIGKKLMGAGSGGGGITPVTFSFTGRDLVIAGGGDGRVYLLDSRSLGGADHKTPLFASEPLTEKGKKGAPQGFEGVFATWMDVDSGSRRIYAPVAGSVHKQAGFEVESGSKGAALVSLTLAGTTEQPTLKTSWAAGPVIPSVAPVIANGIVFAMAPGSARTGAALLVLDAASGKTLNEDIGMPTTPAPHSQMALANGRVYIAGSDNAMYCFGIPGQHSQLVKQ